MSIKRLPSRITSEQYIKQFLQMESIHIQRVNELNALYAGQHSTYKAGQVIEIPPGKKIMIDGKATEGYNVFMVLMVRPRIIKLDSKKTISISGEPAIKETYDILFDLYGDFRGPEMPPYRGQLIFEKEGIKSDELDKA